MAQQQQDIDTEIGDRVHQQMWRSRLTQKQLADALGVDQAAISRRLRGRTAWKVAEVYALARLMGIPADALMPAPEMTAAPVAAIGEGAGALNACSRPSAVILPFIPRLADGISAGQQRHVG